MGSIRLLIPLFILSVSNCHALINPVFSGTRSDTVRKVSDNIIDYKYLLTMRLFVLAQNASYTLLPGTINELVYRPNETGRIGITAFYKWFGLGLSMGTRLFRLDPEKYGTTQTIDARINVYGKPVIVEGFLQYYEGFYVKHNQYEEEIFLMPDMTLFSIGAAASYIYNHDRFSIRAAYIHNERQLKSAGSLMIQPSIKYYRVHSGSGILPDGLFPAIDSGNLNVHEGDFISTGLGPGYIYSFVIKEKFYITTGILSEVRWNYHEYNTASDAYIYHTVSFPFTVRLATGYNSDTWFIGGSYYSTPVILYPNKAVANLHHFDLTQIRFWIGTRFNVIKKHNKKK
jgi:hypothetical protein